MINDFDNFSWDYNPDKDPYVKRASNIHSEPREGGEEMDVRYETIMFFEQLSEALVGVVERADGPAIACYDSLKSLKILESKHKLNAKDARTALNQLMLADFGPASPCFLDTTILKK